MIVGNKIWWYYCGCNHGHATDSEPTGSIGLAIWRLDGFVSINVNKYPGSLTTKPLKFSVRSLVINYSTSAAGNIRIELQDENGAPLPGYALEDCRVICGDEIEQAVQWKGHADESNLAACIAR